jgi:hypothetical protein
MGIAAANYVGAAWIDRETITFGWRPPSDEVSEPLRLVHASPGALVHTPLPFSEATDDCWRIQERNPVRLPDGRLGFVRLCQPRGESDASVILHDIVALDLATGTEEVLARLGDVGVFDGKRNLYSITFNPSLETGAAYLGTRICDAVSLFDSGGVRPLDQPVGPGGGSNLAEPFEKPCAETVNARSPAFSPDGSQLALFVSEGAKGRDGEARLTVPWEVLLIPVDGDPVKSLVAGFSDPRDLAWSPDGSWLVLSDTSLNGTSTVALIKVRDAKVVPLALSRTDRITALSWAPDGLRLVGLAEEPLNADAESTSIPVIIDLGSAIGQ